MCPMFHLLFILVKYCLDKVTENDIIMTRVLLRFCYKADPLNVKIGRDMEC